MRLPVLSIILALLLAPAAASAAPVPCAREIDDTGRFVDGLAEIFGRITGSGTATAEWGALAANLDPETLDSQLAGLSSSERSRMAREMLGILGDADLARGTGCDTKRVRYNAAAVLARLVEVSPAAERATLFDCLVTAASAEKDPALRRQLGLDLDRLSKKVPAASRKKAKALITEVLPDSPPYDAIFGADGNREKVKMTIHTAKEVFRGSPYASTLRAAGAKIVKTTPTDWMITWKVSPDDPTGRLKPVTYEIHMVDHYDDYYENLDVFRDMGNDDPQIEMYDFHAQYGAALDESIKNAPRAPDAKKLFLNVSCKSKTMANRAAALYPKTHLINTKDGEYFSDTPVMLVNLLREMANRSTYSQIRRTLKANDLENYQLPDDRMQLEYLDADADGVADAHDRHLSCGRTKAPNENTFEARAPAANILELDGEKVLRAVSVANGVMGYNLDVGPAWEDRFVSAGWATPDPNGPMAQFSKAPGTSNKWNVKVNAAYSHLDDTALTAALTREFTLFGSTNGHPERATLDQKINAYETGVDLLTAWWGEDHYDGYQATFPLPRAVSWTRAANALDKHDGSTAETIRKIRDLVR